MESTTDKERLVAFQREMKRSTRNSRLSGCGFIIMLILLVVVVTVGICYHSASQVRNLEYQKELESMTTRYALIAEAFGNCLNGTLRSTDDPLTMYCLSLSETMTLLQNNRSIERGTYKINQETLVAVATIEANDKLVKSFLQCTISKIHLVYGLFCPPKQIPHEGHIHESECGFVLFSFIEKIADHLVYYILGITITVVMLALLFYRCRTSSSVSYQRALEDSKMVKGIMRLADIQFDTLPSNSNSNNNNNYNNNDNNNDNHSTTSIGGRGEGETGYNELEDGDEDNNSSSSSRIPAYKLKIP